MQILELESQKPILEKLYSEIRDAAMTQSRVNHTVIVGHRGVGKTTVLRELTYRILGDTALNEHFRVINPPFLFNGSQMDAELERIIANADISSVKKHHLLLIDDLHLLLGDAEGVAHLLRKVLLRTEPTISLIATADLGFREQLLRDSALYGFLRILEMRGLDDSDVRRLLTDVVQGDSWKTLNTQLALTNPFWLDSITGSNARLLIVLKNVLCAAGNKSMSPDDLLKSYFEFVGPFFLNELMEIPRNNRYFLEAASLLGRSFYLKEIDADLVNPSQEASRLQQRGFLDRQEKGTYSFHFPPLKAWLRYAKNLPLGLVLNVDIDVARAVR